MAKRKLPTLFGPKQSSRIEDMSWKGPLKPSFGGETLLLLKEHFAASLRV